MKIVTLRSGKLIPFLLATSPRHLGCAAAFAPTTSSVFPLPTKFGGRDSHLTKGLGRTALSSTDSDMTDEVSAAKAAAAEYKSSDNDGAGPATAFDNILSGKWPSDKVYEDSLALAFREYFRASEK